VELKFNVKHWSSPSKGGHFFALEQPKVLADDIEKFFYSVVDFQECKDKAPKLGYQPFLREKCALLMAFIAAAVLHWKRWA